MTVYFEGGPLDGRAEVWFGNLPPDYRLTDRLKNFGGNAFYRVAVYGSR